MGLWHEVRPAQGLQIRYLCGLSAAPAQGKYRWDSYDRKKTEKKKEKGVLKERRQRTSCKNPASAKKNPAATKGA